MVLAWGREGKGYVVNGPGLGNGVGRCNEVRCRLRCGEVWDKV